jgi:hypothetical protein
MIPAKASFEHIFKDNFTRKPLFFTQRLLQQGRGIPSSFWKFTDIAWRFFVGPGKPGPDGPTWPCEFVTTTEQLRMDYNINKTASRKWIAAYSVSCLASVKLGQYKLKGQANTPTVIKYWPRSTEEDWACFIVALSQRCIADKKKHHAGSDIGFRISLAWDIRRVRGSMGLTTKPLDGWLERLKQEGFIIERDGMDYVSRERASGIQNEFYTNGPGADREDPD